MANPLRKREGFGPSINLNASVKLMPRFTARAIADFESLGTRGFDKAYRDAPALW
jgi:hypothetical protein